jgi:hypothetical protein
MFSNTRREDGGVASFELNLRYNQLLKQRYTLKCQVQGINDSNEGLLHRLNKACDTRLAAEMETLKNVHCLNHEPARVAVPEQGEPGFGFSISSTPPTGVSPDSPVRIETPDARTVAKLELEVHELSLEFDRLVNLNHFLSKEVTLLQAYDPSIVLVRFHNVTNPCDIKRYFLSCPRDSLIDDIVLRLPSDWNVSLTSQFVGTGDRLGVFNKPGARLKDLRGWVRYLELGGLVFVSDCTTGAGSQTAVTGEIPSPPLESDAGGDSRSRKSKRAGNVPVLEDQPFASPSTSSSDTGRKKRKVTATRDKKVPLARKKRKEATSRSNPTKD